MKTNTRIRFLYLFRFSRCHMQQRVADVDSRIVIGEFDQVLGVRRRGGGLCGRCGSGRGGGRGGGCGRGLGRARHL